MCQNLNFSLIIEKALLTKLQLSVKQQVTDDEAVQRGAQEYAFVVIPSELTVSIY